MIIWKSSNCIWTLISVGCIVDTIAAIVELYNDDFQYYKKFKKIYPEDIDTWDFKECGCASTKFINTYFNTKRFFEHLKFMPDAYNSIMMLARKYDVYIVSHGYSPNLKLKENWIKNNLPFCIEFIGVNLKKHSDKSCVNMSDGVFIDDKLSNIKSSNAKKNILFGKEYSWNIDNSDDKSYVRCFTWNEILYELL